MSKSELPADGRLAKRSFGAAWPGIKAVLSTADLCQIDRVLVDPALGVLVFDNPGATVNVYRFEHLYEFFRDPVAPTEQAAVGVGTDGDIAGGAAAEFPRLLSCPLRDGAMPTYDCNTERWSPAGCIHSGRVSLRKAEPTLVSSDPAEGDPALGEFVNRAERWITDAVSNDTRYYFGRVEGLWRLLAIDVVTPCSA